MNKYLTMIDFISEKPQILLNNSTRAKTVYGGILSLISVLLISVALITFCLDLFNKKTSTMTYNQVPVTNVTYNFGQFPWMVALLDNGIKLIDQEDRYYNFYADVWGFTPDNSTGTVVMALTRTQVKAEKCNIDKHFGNYKEYFKNVPYLTHHYCAVPGQNVSLYGIYGSTQPYNFMDFWISTCVNDTTVNRTDCYSRDQSVARLVNTFISYQFLEYFLDHSNIKTPGQLILRSEILPVSSTIYKRDWFYIRNINYFSDLGFIFEQSVEQDYMQTSTFKETVDLRPQGTVPGSFALISVMLDSNVDVYHRRFTKAQEVLANIGGLFKGISVMVYLINYICFDEIYYMSMVSGIFKMNIPEENFKQTKVKSTNAINLTFIPFINITRVDNLVKIGPKKLDKRPNDISLSICELICVRCYTKKKLAQTRMKYYSLAKNYTESHMCIKSILEKLSEIGKLKCFLFNAEQASVYNSIMTPSYYNIDSNTKDIWDDVQNKNFDRKPIENLNAIKSKIVKTDIEMNFLKVADLFEI